MDSKLDLMFRLAQLDNDDDVTLSQWEVNFVESIMRQNENPIWLPSKKQTDLLNKILLKHGY